MHALKKAAGALVLLGAAALAPLGASADNTSYNWGGLYIGANVGWIGTNVSGTYVDPAVAPAFNRHDTDHGSGVLGGHVGLQHQFGQFLVGVEGAYSGTGSFGDWGRSFGRSPSCGVATGLPWTCSNRADSLFTVGPRLGWAPSSQWLLFVNGGFASARVDTETLITSTGRLLARTSARHDGWYLGGGVEYALTPNWILGLEYQHVNLDSERHFNSLDGGCCSVSRFTKDVDADADIVRARISYKFGRRDDAPAQPLK